MGIQDPCWLEGQCTWAFGVWWRRPSARTGPRQREAKSNDECHSQSGSLFLYARHPVSRTRRTVAEVGSGGDRSRRRSIPSDTLDTRSSARSPGAWLPGWKRWCFSCEVSFFSLLSFPPFLSLSERNVRERNWNRGMWKAWKLLFFFRLLGFSFLRRGVFGWISRGNREFFSCDSSFFERCRSFRIVKRRKDRGVDFVYSVGWIKYRNLRLYVNVWI